jgi:glucose-1-phosphate adenylyltransferase
VFKLYNERWLVYTNYAPLPPAKISRGIGGEPSYVDGTLMCQGSIVSGGHVEHSIIGPEVFIDHDAHVTSSIVFPGVRIGAGARMHRAIVDKNVTVPPGMRIGFDPEEDRQRFHVSEAGLVVIEKGMLLA